MNDTLLAEHSFLWWRTSEWEAIGVCVTAALTIFLVIYAIRQLGHARRVRDEQTRPYVIVDFSFRDVLIELSVKNIGQTAARNVRVKLADELTSAADIKSLAWQHEGLFGDGVAMFAPGREMRYLFDRFDTRMSSGLPMSISGTINYQRHDGRQ